MLGISCSIGHIMCQPQLQYMWQSNINLKQKERKKSLLRKCMHPANIGEMSEAEAASNELIPDRVPAIDTAFCMANINEARFLLNNVLNVLIFLMQAGTSASFMGLIACVYCVLLISLFQRDCETVNFNNLLLPRHYDNLPTST